MSTLVSNILPETVVEQARSLIGIKWRHQGRNENGIDCIGTVLVTAWKLGIEMRDSEAYSRFYIPEMLIKAALERGFRPIPKPEMQIGDVLYIKVGRTPTHVAILSSFLPKMIIHALEPAQRVREQIMSPQLEARISHVFRFPGVI